MARFASGLLAADNLIGPNKDQDNFGLLKACDLIGTIMGRGSISGCCRPVSYSTRFRPNLLFRLLKAH